MIQQRGFTLIELLVGATIGIIGLLLISQAQDVFDNYKRGLSSGGEAQVAGTVAGFQLERALRNAGMGFGASPFLGCQVNAFFGATALNMWLAPVRIVDGINGAPDQIQILSGNSESPSSSYNIVCSDVTSGVECTGPGTSQLNSNAGLRVGDLAVMTAPGPPATCRLVQINSVNEDGKRITTRPVAIGNYTSQPVGLPFDANPSKRFLYNLGSPPSPPPAARTSTDVSYSAWAINATRTVNLGANTLIRFEPLRAPVVGSEMADNIVDLQAQYGLVATPDHPVARWTARDPTVADALDPIADPAGWTRVGMVRFALLVRGQQVEKTPVTTAAPVWLCGGAIDSAVTCPFTMRNVDGTADSGVSGPAANNWRYYRYKVHEVTVPLRNVIWRTAW